MNLVTHPSCILQYDDSYTMCLQGSEAFQTEKVQVTTLLPKNITQW